MMRWQEEMEAWGTSTTSSKVEGSQLSSVSKLVLARVIRKIKVEHAERNPHRVLLRTRRAVEGQVE